MKNTKTQRSYLRFNQRDRLRTAMDFFLQEVEGGKVWYLNMIMKHIVSRSTSCDTNRTILEFNYDKNEVKVCDDLLIADIVEQTFGLDEFIYLIENVDIYRKKPGLGPGMKLKGTYSRDSLAKQRCK